MAYVDSSRFAFVAWLALIFLLVRGGGAEESDRSLLNFEVSLPEEVGRVEFVCDLGVGYLETSNSVSIDSSELDLLEKVIVSYQSSSGLKEFVCWREKLDILLPPEILEDLWSQILEFLTYRPRSLLGIEGPSPRPSPPRTNLTGKSDKHKPPAGGPSNKVLGVAPEPSKNTSLDQTMNATGSPTNATASPPTKLVEKPVDPPPTSNESHPPSLPPPPPPPPASDGDKEKHEPTETPVDPTDQAAQRQHTDDSKYNVCEEGKNLVARLLTSGDGTQTLTLSLRNDGEGVLVVQINTPTGLLAEPSVVSLKKGGPEVKVHIAIVDQGQLSNKEELLISSREGDCTVPINLNELGNWDSRSYFDRFSMPSMPAVITPEMRLGAFFIILSVVGGLVIWRMWARWIPRDGAGAGHSYQELEMAIPSNADNLSPAYGQDRGDKSGSGGEDGWDEGWDDWEDTEAARSSARLIPGLSAKGLAARRSNKDGWETAWDD
ncbi:hypothetical protein R1flu_017878 [Riccia fluitans]|uniref:DUF7356 domain-containing protein n=1 Tax=Riccia fluitans TaxID=41844 RepID=A0ABD1ZEH8_9MARC